MSIKAMQYVFESTTTKGSQRLMLIAIADRCDDEGTCYPGINTLAKKCNVQRRQAQNLIQDLERLGEIRVAEGQGIKTNGGATNRYYMTGYIKANDLPIDETNFRDVEPKKARKKKAKTTPMQPAAPRATNNVTPVQHFAKVVQPAAPDSKLNTNTNSKKKTSSAKAESKPKKKREPDLIFNAIADVSFGITDTSAINGNGGRIGKIKKRVLESYPAIQCADLYKFKNWYTGKYPNTPVPRDPEKFIEHYIAFNQSFIPPAPVVTGYERTKDWGT
jgi:hypothetical protein